MSKKHLNDYVNSRTADEGLERQAFKAWMTVLNHKAILEGKDLDALAHVAEFGEGRDKVRAAERLAEERGKAAEGIAHNTAMREEIMEAKGLRQEGTKVQVFAFEGMDLERLKALAEGRLLLDDQDKPANQGPGC